MLTNTQKSLWIEALRSGEWKQTIGEWNSPIRDDQDSYLSWKNLNSIEFQKKHASHCCLDVLRCLLGYPVDDPSSESRVLNLLDNSSKGKWSSLTHSRLIELNDDEGLKFPEIADWIETNLTTVED